MNPKLTFQIVVLLFASGIFLCALLFLKIFTGENLRTILKNHLQIQTFSLGAALLLVILVFILFIMINNEW